MARKPPSQKPKRAQRAQRANRAKSRFETPAPFRRGITPSVATYRLRRRTRAPATYCPQWPQIDGDEEENAQEMVQTVADHEEHHEGVDHISGGPFSSTGEEVLSESDLSGFPDDFSESAHEIVRSTANGTQRRTCIESFSDHEEVEAGDHRSLRARARQERPTLDRIVGPSRQDRPAREIPMSQDGPVLSKSRAQREEVRSEFIESDTGQETLEQRPESEEAEEIGVMKVDSEDTVHYVPPTASDPAASAGLRGFRRQPEPGEPSGFSNGRIYPNPRNPYLPTPPRPQEQCSERASPRSEAQAYTICRPPPTALPPSPTTPPQDPTHIFPHLNARLIDFERLTRTTHPYLTHATEPSVIYDLLLAQYIVADCVREAREQRLRPVDELEYLRLVLRFREERPLQAGKEYPVNKLWFVMFVREWWGKRAGVRGRE